VRFINLVKHIIDKESGMESLSEIPAIFSGKNASIDKCQRQPENVFYWAA